MEHASFNPVTTTPHSTPQTPPRPVHRCLSFNSADNYTPDSTPVCSDSSDEEDMKIFRWYLWMMNTGLLKKHLKELFVSMNMDYRITYANTHVLMRTITLSSYMDSLDLSDISDYEDYMVTSSDEEIPGMEEVLY